MVTERIVVKSDVPAAPDVERAAQLLIAGKLVAFPTETVYGLGAVYSDEIAVGRLWQVKQRSEEKKTALAVYALFQAERFGVAISPCAYRVCDQFLPGPVTVVFPGSEHADDIGFRMPAHPVARLLLRRVAVPVYLPSANRAGNPPPFSAAAVLRDLDTLIDAVVDAGNTPLTAASTVCRIAGEDIRVLRPGPVPETALRAVIGQRQLLIVCTGNSCRSPMAEAFMRRALGSATSIQVSSAGTATIDGMFATAEAIDAAVAYDCDIREHRSRQLTAEILKRSDWIFVMEERHRRAVIDMWPAAAPRTFLLKAFAFAPGPVEVPDPVGRGAAMYAAVARDLHEAVQRVAQQLL